jgi:hypothetical protein
METNEPENVKVELITPNEVAQQIQGMKELFATLIHQNKKEYEMQLQQIKSVFVDTLTQTQQQYQQQVQEIISSLPNLIDKTLVNAQDKNLIYLGNASDEDKIKKMEKIDAVTEIIAGEELRTLQHHLTDLQDNIQQIFEKDKQNLTDFQNFAHQLLKQVLQNIFTETENTHQRLQLLLTEQDQRLANKANTSTALHELGFSHKF